MPASSPWWGCPAKIADPDRRFFRAHLLVKMSRFFLFPLFLKKEGRNLISNYYRIIVFIVLAFHHYKL